jgi:hypothetical protein
VYLAQVLVFEDKINFDVSFMQSSGHVGSLRAKIENYDDDIVDRCSSVTIVTGLRDVRWGFNVDGTGIFHEICALLG